MLQLTAEMIAIKRDGGVLSRQMIEDLVRGITDMSLSDARLSQLFTNSIVGSLAGRFVRGCLNQRWRASLRSQHTTASVC